MKRICNVLISDDNRLRAEVVRRNLAGIGQSRAIIAESGSETLKTLRDRKPDVLLLNMVLPGIDGLSIIRTIRNMKLARLPHVVALIEPGQDMLGQSALDLGACLTFDKNELGNSLPYVIDKAMNSPRRTLLGGTEMESRLYWLLINLGVSRRLDGFKYVQECVLLSMEDIDYQNNLSKLLYPTVAKKYNTRANCVERSIRHAVEMAWSRGRLSVLQEEFGNTIDSSRGKPTNSEFIARMVDKLRNGGSFEPND